MRVTIEKAELLKALDLLSKARGEGKNSKTAFMIAEAGRIHFYRLDIGFRLRVTASAEVQEPGAGAAIPIYRAKALLKCLEPGPLSIESGETIGGPETSIGKYNFNQTLLDAGKALGDFRDSKGAWINFSDIAGAEEIPEPMKAALKTAARFAAKDLTRYGLTGICLHGLKDKVKSLEPGLHVVSTCGSMLFCSEAFSFSPGPSWIKHEQAAIISVGYVNLISGSSSAKLEIRRDRNGENIRVDIVHSGLSVSIEEKRDLSDFPDWMAILPEEQKGREISSRRLSSRIEAIIQTMESPKMDALCIASDSGEGEEERLALWTKDTIDDPSSVTSNTSRHGATGGINALFALEAIRAFSSGKASVTLSQDVGRPFVFRGGPGKALIMAMPMRIK